jgi:hypothetical protein
LQQAKDERGEHRDGDGVRQRRITVVVAIESSSIEPLGVLAFHSLPNRPCGSRLALIVAVHSGEGIAGQNRTGGDGTYAPGSSGFALPLTYGRNGLRSARRRHDSNARDRAGTSEEPPTGCEQRRRTRNGSRRPRADHPQPAEERDSLSKGVTAKLTAGLLLRTPPVAFHEPRLSDTRAYSRGALVLVFVGARR